MVRCRIPGGVLRCFVARRSGDETTLILDSTYQEVSETERLRTDEVWRVGPRFPLRDFDL